MKSDWSALESLRYNKTPIYRSNEGDHYGAFFLPAGRASMLCIADDGRNPTAPAECAGWEHVSVRDYAGVRTPSWAEMCRVKDAFWFGTETVLQYHPARADYVNMHPHCLHLWRPIDGAMPRPNSLLGGYQSPLAAPLLP